MTVLAVMTLAAFTTPSAFAGSDLPSGPGVVSNSVMVSGTYEALGYTGGIFGIHQEVVSETGTFVGAEGLEVGENGLRLSWIDGCVGNLPFASATEAGDRREDGSVEVLLQVWTFRGCPHRDQYGYGGQLARVAPGESVTLEAFARNSNGDITVSATFTNIWTPWYYWVLDYAIRDWLFRSERVAISAVATEQPQVRKSPKIHTSEVDKPIVDVVDPDMPVIGTDEPDTSGAVKDETHATEQPAVKDESQATEQPAVKDESQATEESGGDELLKIDTSEWDAPLVTVPVPLPPLNLDPDPKGSALIDAIDLTNVVDLTDLVKPSITILIVPSFGGSFDF